MSSNNNNNNNNGEDQCGQGFWEDDNFWTYDSEYEDTMVDEEVQIKDEEMDTGYEPMDMDDIEFLDQSGGNVEVDGGEEMDGEVDEAGPSQVNRHFEDDTSNNEQETPVGTKDYEPVNISELYSYAPIVENRWYNTVNRTRYEMVFDRNRMKGLAAQNHRFYALCILDIASRMRNQFPDNVQMGIEIGNKAFDKPFCFHLRPIAKYRSDFIERELDTRMQSAKQLNDPGSVLDVTVTFAVPLAGSGKPRPTTMHLLKKLGRAPNLFGNGAGTVGAAREATDAKRATVQFFNNDVRTHCLATAICQAIARIQWQILDNNHPDKQKAYTILRRWKKIKQGGGRKGAGKELWAQAVKLLEDSGVTRTEDFEMTDVAAIQMHLHGQYQILVFNGNFHGSDPVFKGEYVDYQRIIGLRLMNNHYDVISSINVFMGVTHYCTFCFKGAGSYQLHYNCALKCTRCLRGNCPKDGTENIKCRTCKLTFKTRECYDAHLAPGPCGGRSRCQNTKLCKKCGEAYYTDHAYQHICGKKYCHQCRQMKGPNHKHVLSELKERKKYTQKRIFFDAETQVVSNGSGMKEHEAVVILAMRCCPSCNDDIPENLTMANQSVCEDCSPDDNGQPGPRVFQFTKIHPGEENVDVMKRFGEWLFQKSHYGFTAMAHNLKGFDGQLILQYLLNENRPKPDKIVMAGRKLNFLDVGGVRLIDSYNFVPFGLATFSKSFGIKELKKGYFPFKFIQPAHYNYIGPVPDKQMYDYDTKTEEAKKKFDSEFYDERVASGALFNFREEILEYCYADVALLAKSMILYEADFYKLTNVMIYEECVTAASAAMAVFRRNFLTDKAMVLDSDPCSRRLKQSSVARRFLAYMQSEESEPIMSANNVGEFNIPGTNYHVDGYIAPCDKYEYGKVIEYKGCYHHMHWCSYDATQMTSNGERAMDVWRRDSEREKKIKEFCPVLEVHWGCEVAMDAKTNPKLASYLEKNLNYGPAIGLEALFGGRTEPIRLRKKASPTTVLRYMDFTSLYPFVMKTCEYPVGEPAEIMGQTIQCPISTPDQLLSVCRGYMSCKILPPAQLFLPVLPLRGEKLLFPLCSACAQFATDQEPVPNPCPHSDEERTLYGTWTTVELALALEKGYVITAVFGAVHWPENQWLKYKKVGGNVEDGLFSKYINTFLKLKQEASGFPAAVTTETEKDEYIEKYYQEEGVRMEKEKIEKSPVMRQIAKLLLNSLWGKFGERIDKVKTHVVTHPNEFYMIMNNPAVHIMSINIHNSYAITVQTRAVEGALFALPTSAMPYAILTTAHARVQLYRALDMIPDPEQNVLYMDTDSVIYAADASSPNPLESISGDYLGQLTDEIDDGMMITDFVTVGAKSYAYEVARIADPTVKKIHLKAKGFPRTGEMEDRVTMAKMKQQVAAVLDRRQQLAMDPDADIPEVPVATVRYHQIRADANHRLTDTEMTKVFRFTFDKRHILPDGGTLPFGFK